MDSGNVLSLDTSRIRPAGKDPESEVEFSDGSIALWTDPRSIKKSLSR